MVPDTAERYMCVHACVRCGVAVAVAVVVVVVVMLQLWQLPVR